MVWKPALVYRSGEGRHKADIIFLFPGISCFWVCDEPVQRGQSVSRTYFPGCVGAPESDRGLTRSDRPIQIRLELSCGLESDPYYPVLRSTQDPHLSLSAVYP